MPPPPSLKHEKIQPKPHHTMKTKSDSPGVAFLTDMLSRAVRTNRSPLPTRPAKAAPEPEREASAEELQEACKAVSTMSRLLNQFADSRDESDRHAKDAEAASQRKQSLADAILAGGSIPEVLDRAAGEKALQITRAIFEACNRHTPAASKAARLIQNTITRRARVRLAEAEKALRDSMPPGLDANSIKHAVTFAPALQPLRKALADVTARPGGLLPIKLHTPMQANPQRRGKAQAAGKARAVLQPLRLAPLPSDAPPVSKNDPWNPRLVAGELDRLVAEMDSSEPTASA